MHRSDGIFKLSRVRMHQDESDKKAVLVSSIMHTYEDILQNTIYQCRVSNTRSKVPKTLYVEN